MSIIFTAERIDDLKKRYERRIPPSIYHVATRDKLQWVRDGIEAGATGLPQTALDKIIPSLFSTENFMHTYHDLIVRKYLLEAGYDPQYEADIDGLTPD